MKWCMVLVIISGQAKAECNKKNNIYHLTKVAEAVKMKEKQKTLFLGGLK